MVVVPIEFTAGEDSAAVEFVAAPVVDAVGAEAVEEVTVRVRFVDERFDVIEVDGNSSGTVSNGEELQFVEPIRSRRGDYSSAHSFRNRSRISRVPWRSHQDST